MRHVGKIKNNDKGNYFLSYGKSVSHYRRKHLKVEKEGSQMTHSEPCEAGAHDTMLNISHHGQTQAFFSDAWEISQHHPVQCSNGIFIVILMHES